MILINYSCYIRNYKLLKVGTSRFMLMRDIMLIINDDIIIVYKKRCLIGSVLSNRSIFTDVAFYAHAFNFGDTRWTKLNMCGCFRNHGIPFYDNADSLSLYGFRVTQFEEDTSDGGKINEDQYMRVCKFEY